MTPLIHVGDTETIAVVVIIGRCGSSKWKPIVFFCRAEEWRCGIDLTPFVAVPCGMKIELDILMMQFS